MDLPVISVFPATSEEEWLRYPNFGLRTADAYLLVYDASNPSSFSYVQLMRSGFKRQIFFFSEKYFSSSFL